mgnify:CR=1 FL=1
MKNKAIALALLLSVVGCSESNKEATEEAKKEAMMEMEKAGDEAADGYEEGKEKAKETRRVNNDALYNLELNINGDNFIEYYNWKKGKSIKDKIEWLKSKNNE